MSTSTDEEGVVFFEMPGGHKVTNDARYNMFNDEDAREEYLASFADRGRVGSTPEEVAAQTGHGEHPLQSGQDGDFEVDDLAVDGRTVNPDAADAARDAGNTPNDPKVIREVSDSNEAVMAVREAEAKRQEAQAEAAGALAAAGGDEGDGPYEGRTGKQLKAVLARRQAERAAAGEDPIDTAGVTKKAQLAALLRQDDDSRG